MTFRTRASFCSVCASICAIATLHAEPVTAAEAIEEMVVVAHPLSGEGLAQPTSELHGDALNRAMAGTLGETLINQPGVHSASFGQAVGRPVIRGLGGPRVKVMEDRIDSLDVSVSSPDHATTIEPFTAERIEVLKGPSTLLYGNGAIGGVVDVHSGRIPHNRLDAVRVKAEARGADNADQRTAAGMVEAGTGNLVFHADGFLREADDYEIPGYAESEALRALEEEEGEGGEEDEVRDVLPGSDLDVSGGALGLSYVFDRGFVGASVSVYDAVYGIPGGHSHEHEHEHEEGEEEEDHEEGGHGEEAPPFIDLEQTRIDFEAGLERPWRGAESLNLRIGWNEYQHAEIEGNGEIGTMFDNEALEGRLELLHEEVSTIKGAAGIQFADRDYSAIGEEAYVPPVATDSFGIFYVAESSLQLVDLEAGVRYERVSHDPLSGLSRDFDLGAASFGVIAAVGTSWTVAMQLDYSTRAPTVEELYSDGPHLATGSYEVGDPDLSRERALNGSATVEYENDAIRVGVSGYYISFADFIYESPTGAEIEELPVFQWLQADATFQGLDLEAEWRAVRWEDGEFTLRGFYDQVRARRDEGSDRNLPRIPPRRFGIGAGLDWRGFTATLDFARSSAQNATADFELPTEGFDDLRVYLGYGFGVGDDGQFELFLAGRNLTNDEQRHHTSFIKDFAPQPGRTVEAGLRLTL